MPAPKWPQPPKASNDGKLITEFKDVLAMRRNDEREVQDRQRYIRRSFSVGRAFLRDGTNLVILGRTAKRIWATASVRQNAGPDRPSEYRVSTEGVTAVQILIEFHDGVVASAVIYDALITVLSRDKRGVIGWTCVSQWMEVQPQIENSIEVIAGLQLGNLPADKVDGIAAELREMKHVNPTLGAISSYLYDYSGDIDSIRRMAYFYCYHRQAIPFDVAFMGLLPFDGHRSGFRTNVPAVGAREPSPQNDAVPRWITRETPAARGDIAGLWPWLRQGWQFIEDPEPEEKVPAETLRDVIPFLMPSQFSSFRKDGADILIRKFRLEGQA